MASRAESVVLDSGTIVGRRESQRARLHLTALLEGTTRAYRVLLRNLSSTGAMVEGSDLPPVGRMVALKRHGLDAFGTIVWAREGCCGLHFDEPLATDEVISLARSAPEAKAADPMRFYQRPGTDGDRLSPEEWAWAKAYASRQRR